MEEKPSEYDEQAHPPDHQRERASIDDPTTGEDEPPDDVELDVPPAFDPATRPSADR
jgi:hypothetical protein